MTERYADILAHLPAALLVVFRIGGLMIYGPLFASPAIPGRVRVLLAFVTGAAVYPVLAAGPLAGHEPPVLALWSLAPLLCMELAIGLLVGFLASMPLVALQTGGLLMGQQMGLGFAQIVNPAFEDESDILGQILFFMALAGFLIVGGHEAMLLSILHSFEHVGAGCFALDGDVVTLVSGLLTSALELGLRVAAPLLCLVFLESVAMGFVARTVPQLNILSLGFPVRILAGLLVVILGLAVIDEVVMDEIDRVLDMLLTWKAERP